MSLLDAMNAACEDITADHCRGRVRHSRRFFFPGAWQWKTSDVTLMKIFGLTNKSDRMASIFLWMLFVIFVYLW
ncbi:TM2 domain-containing protein 3 [Labeo rohita]|uniref:TM2 domain-containing protein 3 n=1 Tax=Labeo rohita TaxID=84645 RepID=A0ABQ8LCB0_LABRO|nr:TM2 domain-containing protein 3 [Labeo rohita]